jgi:hypothetical protein
MKKVIPKWLKVTWLICIPAGILVAVLVQPLVNNAPEKTKALAFAQTNDEIRALFGSDAQVTDHADYPANVEFYGNGSCEGKYCFRVTGIKGTGKIVVNWKSNRKSDDFKVESIAHYVADGESYKTIWRSEQGVSNNVLH